MEQGLASHGFIKLFGRSSSRAPGSMPVLEEVRRSGSHWACTYPKRKRPRRVRDGSLMFMGRMVEEPNDIMIYGRAVGMRYMPGRDDVTPADIQLRDWKKDCPYYIRVHDVEFIAGRLSNCVSLNGMMAVLKSDAFMSTQRNAALGKGNTDPRWAYRQQAAVEVSLRAIAWLDELLELAFVRHGRISQADLDKLDWPSIPIGLELGPWSR